MTTPVTWDAWGGAWSDSWGASWVGTIRPTTARGYDPRRAIILADDEKIIAYAEDFLRRQPWRR